MSVIANAIDAMKRANARVDTLIQRANTDIASSDRPTDAFPLDAIVPVFMVHPDQVDGWFGRIDPVVAKRLEIFAPHSVVTESAERLQGALYALTRDELSMFERGAPILRLQVPILIREALGRGGRKKDVVETKLREALAYQIFYHEIELTAIEASEASAQGKIVDPHEISCLDHFVDHAWVNGVPAKTRASGDESEADRRLAFFASLREEGRRLTPKFAYGVVDIRRFRNAVIADFSNLDTKGWSHADYEAARDRAVAPVLLLMRAYAHVTSVAETKAGYSKRQRHVLETVDGRRAQPIDRTTETVMNRREHGVIAGAAFTPIELLNIAVLADVDPNLVSPTSAIYSIEFSLARKIRNFGFGEPVALNSMEAEVFGRILGHELPVDPMWASLHTATAALAFEIRPRETWLEMLALAAGSTEPR